MKTLRRYRLNELLKSPRFNGDRSAFLASAGISKGRLTQLLDPNEPFGDIAARNLCDALGLPNGWFDASQQSDVTPPTYKPNQDLALIEQAQVATNSVATLGQTLEALAGHLEAMDIDTRRKAILLISDLATDPKSHAATTAMIELSIRSKNQKAA